MAAKLPVPKFNIGETVYPQLSPSSDHARLVTGYIIRANGYLVYLVSDEDGTEMERAEFELTDEIDYSANSGVTAGK